MTMLEDEVRQWAFIYGTRGNVGEWAGKNADLKLYGRMTCIDEIRGDLEEWPCMDGTGG